MNTHIWKFIIWVAVLVTIAVLLPRGVTIGDPEPSARATQVREVDGMVMVYVPAGEFLMGSPDGECCLTISLRKVSELV